MEQSKAAAQRAAAQKAIANGDTSASPRETYTAKQIALRCGTDPKTMRKFFRSKNSTVEPVGQGGRYEFSARDFPKIQREFYAWRKKTAERTAELRARKGLPPEPTPEPTPPPRPTTPTRKPELPTAFYRNGTTKPTAPAKKLPAVPPAAELPVDLTPEPTEADLEMIQEDPDFDIDFALDELDN